MKYSRGSAVFSILFAALVVCIAASGAVYWYKLTHYASQGIEETSTQSQAQENTPQGFSVLDAYQAQVAARGTQYGQILATTGSALPSTPNTTGSLPASSAQPAAAPAASTCVPKTPPPGMFDAFYQKYCVVDGIPILSSAAVPDAALQEAGVIMQAMLAPRPDIAQQLVAHGLRVGIIGKSEFTTTLPDYAQLPTLFPGTDWDTRTRGVGATLTIPMVSAAEENLLCYPSDPYKGESIMVHEFAHTVKDLGETFIDPTFNDRLEQAYESAMAQGLWADTYSTTNKEEYWAEGVESYFDANVYSNPPNGIHNAINTRTKLGSYDPALYALIAEVFPTNWTWSCP